MNDNLASPTDTSTPELAESLNRLAIRLKETDMALTSACQDKMLTYLEMLTSVNQNVNLVGNCDPHILVERHTLDGLTLVAQIRKGLMAKPAGNRVRYLDIGTGGGLPGMIVALCCPEVAVTLMDATAKKCTFLSSVVQKLALSDQIEVVNGRAEELARESQFRERYRFVSARAVGTLKLTIELALPYLKSGGVFLAQKTKSRIAAEMAESRDLLANIGGEIETIEELDRFAEFKEAIIVPVKKLHVTPKQYPRDWKLIAPTK